MKSIFDDAARIHERRKNEVLANMAEADRRLTIRQEEQRRSILRKQRQHEERQQYLEKAQKQQAVHEKKRIDQIFLVRRQKEAQLIKTNKAKEWEATIKKELELLRREERWDNVLRIQKAQEYQQSKVKQKIEFDTMRGEHLLMEKQQLMDTRLQVRRQADRQKRELLARVERLKRKGKIAREDLVSMGLVEDEQAAYNDIFGSPTSSQVVQ